jgi:hypothetical protein
MFLLIKNNIYKRKSFWVMRKRFLSIQFFVKSNIFSLGQWADSVRAHFSIFWNSLREICLSIIIASGVIYGVNYFFPLSVELTQKGAKDLLSTIASLSGVFLGLYFTAFSVVAGSLFSKLTEDVRELFKREKVGNQFVWVLSATTMLSIFYLMLISFGFSVSPAIIIFLTFFSAYGIVRIITLNFRSFSFFDPTIVHRIVLGDFYKFARLSTTEKTFWADANFQNHFQKQATKTVTIFRSLVEYALRSFELFERQSITMSSELIIFLGLYLSFKKKIPSGSLWFKTELEFQHWMLADSIEVSMALNTGTTLQGKETRNHYWVEEESLSIFSLPTESFLRKGKLLSAYSVFEHLTDYSEKTGAEMENKVASLILKQTEKTISIIYNENNHDNKTKERLALVDTQGRMAVAVLLGFTKKIRTLSCVQIQSIVNKIDWLKIESIYGKSLPLAMISNLEEFQRLFEYENKIEGKIVSPQWYAEMLVVNSYLYKVKEFFIYLMTLNEDYFFKGINDLINKKEFLLAVQLIQRWVEFINKYENAIESFKEHENEFKKLHKFKDLKWADFGFEEMEHNLSANKDKAMEILSRLMPELAKIEKEKDIPDYLGYAYTFVSEHCYRACSKGDTDAFGKLFPFFFMGALSLFEVLRKEVQGWSQADSQIAFLSEPLADLIELSGYAKVYAELYEDDDIWKICEKTWGAYLESVQGEQIVKIVFATMSARKNVFTIMPKDMIRIEWERIFKSIMVKKNLISERFGGPFQDYEEVAIHKSKLINFIGKRGLILPFRAGDLFLIYLAKHPKASGVDTAIIGNIKEEFNEAFD